MSRNKSSKRRTKKEIADFIYEEVVLRHGSPVRILTDQGLEFTDSVIVQLCKMIGTDRVTTSAYNPECNGSTERFNQTLLEKLIKLCNADCDDWDAVLPIALYAKH